MGGVETTTAIIDAAEYLEQEPPPIDDIFHGLMDRGDKVFVIGQSKNRKSFFMLQMGLCLASGKPFLNWRSNRRLKVLIIQFELKPANYHRRVRYVASALGIAPDDIRGQLDILNLRGKHFSFDGLQVENYDLIICDPFYNLLDRANVDECSGRDVSRVLGGLDAIAERGPAIAIVHHTTKGRAGDKQAIDRGSGTGVMARDYDCCFTLTPHRDHPSEWIVLETILRNYRSPDAITIEFRDGIFMMRDDVPAEVETSLTAKRGQQAGPSAEELSAIVAEWITGPMKTVEIADRIRKDYRVGEKKAEAVIRQLARDGFVRSKSHTRPAYGIIAPPDSQDSKPPTQKGLDGMA